MPLRIYEDRRPGKRGASIRYRVYLPADPLTGKRKRVDFSNKPAAEAYVASHDQSPDLTEEIAANQVMIQHCFLKLKAAGASIEDATTFFLTHKPKNATAITHSVAELFVRAKTEKGCRAAYLRNLKQLLDNLSELVGPVAVSAVTADQIKGFVFKDDVSDVTKNNNLTMLSVFFNWCKKHGYVTFNPVANLERPRKTRPAPKVITPEQFQTILDRCLTKNWKERVAILSLIGFAGMRRAEACRLNWTDIDLTEKTVTLEAGKAKTGSHRRNELPENAVAWLRTVEDKRRTGPIIGPNADMLLRTAFRCKDVPYHQNALRHSFCSYYLEKHGPDALNKLIADMGHDGNPQMIHRHYRNIVPKGSGAKWFAIVPSPPK